MSQPLTYLPVYIGLYLALLLALISNCFLDIQYQKFGTEVFIWATVHAVTLWVGWSQRGVPTEKGRKWQRWMLVTALLATGLLFMPLWGIPRAGIYMLAALQASYNCVTTTRRHLYIGVLVATVLAMFAAAHHRADWTMLFYLVPFVIVVVFTLVAEQINHHVEHTNRHSLGRRMIGGQGAAIAVASLVILLLAGLLYAATPQYSWAELKSSFGLATPTPQTGGDLMRMKSGTAGNSDGSGDAGALTGEAMRRSAQKPGMPRWQAHAISRLAELYEKTNAVWVPVSEELRQQLQSLIDEIKKRRRMLIFVGMTLLLLLLLAALLWVLAHEIRLLMLWGRTRLDFVLFGLFGWYPSDRRGAELMYRAMERLFAYHDLPRAKTTNAREYLFQLQHTHARLTEELSDITRLFEQARYGAQPIESTLLPRMQVVYCQIFDSATESPA